MKYLKRIGLQLPKPLLDKLDRIILRDGRRRAEVIRTLIWQFIQGEEAGTIVRRNSDTAGGAAGGPALGATR